LTGIKGTAMATNQVIHEARQHCCRSRRKALPMRTLHRETHLIERIGWLRAAVPRVRPATPANALLCHKGCDIAERGVRTHRDGSRVAKSHAFTAVLTALELEVGQTFQLLASEAVTKPQGGDRCPEQSQAKTGPPPAPSNSTASLRDATHVAVVVRIHPPLQP
jgi:hypothetical protein